jgi:hypothetical protein
MLLLLNRLLRKFKVAASETLSFLLNSQMKRYGVTSIHTDSFLFSSPYRMRSRLLFEADMYFDGRHSKCLVRDLVGLVTFFVGFVSSATEILVFYHNRLHASYNSAVKVCHCISMFLSSSEPLPI